MKKDPVQNGFVTVEAALLFPFIICVILAVIYFSFYMFGKVCVVCDSDRVLLREERIYRDTGRIDNISFYGDARRALTGYPLASCVVSRCYSDYGEMVLEYVFNADLLGSVLTDELSELFDGVKEIRQHKADDRITKARYIAVGKNVYTKIKGYARGWRNGS